MVVKYNPVENIHQFITKYFIWKKDSHLNLMMDEQKEINSFVIDETTCTSEIRDLRAIGFLWNFILFEY